VKTLNYKDDLRKELYKPTRDLIEKLDKHRDEISKLEFLKAEVRIWEEKQRRQQAN
jgi:molybdopterin synthase catalytic subunit